MPDRPPSDRFKTEMPQIPGVSAPGAHSSVAEGPSANLLVGGLLALLVLVFLGTRWALHPRSAETKVADQQPQIEVPSPAPDPNTLLPHATDASPGIAETEEMAKPWSSKEFFMRSRGANIRGMLIRLPIGSASQTSAYWAFSQNSPFGNCRLEYVTDLAKLRSDYGYRAAKHPMVGNPCSRAVFDPLRMSNLPGNVFVRGGIVQGSDLRPPLSIEVRVRGKDILAIRAE